MDLLNLAIKIFAQDEASETIDDVSKRSIGKLVDAAKNAAKALAGMWAVKKVVEFGKAAFDAYSQFEQLEGGVAKLYGNANMELDEYLASMKDSGKSVDELTKTYERNEEAQKLMMQQASEAWKTAGVDANTYMEQATSMSAALISSLGGDTVKAAQQTDVAMRAISDNVNTFGTDMGSVSQAFMGFSKQNYTMLDNLKLGYGGTKTEMERLIADANKWAKENGKAADLSIDKFSDVVTAIDYIQQKQGIAGTTTREAMTTIEGSMNATKAAWQNLVTEFGKPDADLGARIKDMFTAVMGENGEGGLLRNVAKEVGVIARNMIGAVADGIGAGFDWLLDNGPKLVGNALRELGDAIERGWNGLMDFEGLDLGSVLFGDGESAGIVGRVQGFVQGIGDAITEWWPYVTDQLGFLWEEVGLLVQEYGPQILDALGTVLGNIGNWLLENGPTLIGNVAEAWYSLVEWVTAHGPEIVDKVAEIVGNVVDTAWQWLVDNGPKILLAVGETLVNIATAILDHGPEILGNIAETIGTVLSYVGDAATDMLPKAVEFMGGLLTGTSQEGEKLREWFAGLPQTLLDALGDLSTFLVDAGQQILQGFWDGLTSKWDEVTGWVEGIGDWIADHKGPKAYDLGLLVDNGKWIMQSLQTGLEKGLPPVEDTLSDITDSIQTGINTSVSVAKAPSQTDAALMGMLGAIRDNMSMKVYLDSGRLVGGIAPQMNVAMGRL